ncbi:MAG TPA: hypothetical protein VMS74_15025 [Acidimicrobiia bacterium]|nr:hypothetical protein [Acidimicrobiia bacterium]
MTTTEHRAPRLSGALRRWTMVLGWGALIQGGWAYFWPRSFYEDFPVDGAAWVSTLGPFNDHLIQDVGAALIGMGAAALVAAVRGDVSAIRAVASGFVLFGVAHLGFHLGELDHFSPAAATTQVATLVALVLLPAALVSMTGRWSR